MTSSPRMRNWRGAIQFGLIGGICAVYVCLIGAVSRFHERALIDGVITLGQALIVVTALGAGYLAASRAPSTRPLDKVVAGTAAGLITGVFLSALVVVGAVIPLRAVLLEASDSLYGILTLGYGAAAAWLPMLVGALCGAIAGAAYASRRSLRQGLVVGLVGLLVLGVFATVIRTPLLASPITSELGRLLFGGNGGLTMVGAIVTLAATIGNDVGLLVAARTGFRRGPVIGGIAGGAIGGLAGGWLARIAFGAALGGDQLTAGAGAALLGGLLGIASGTLIGLFIQRSIVRSRIEERVAALPDASGRAVHLAVRLVVVLVALTFVVWLPIGVGPFFAQVVVLVALYVLMGLGLNITLGLAGLLDLGFVAFFAVGSYTVALLTSTAEFGIAQWPFWAAVPFAVILAMVFGGIFGLPILGIRGDYLAIATLGFGEIIGILAKSNLMLPLLGGPRGIVNVPKPIEVPPTDPLSGPVQIYYIAIACAAVIAFIALRLRASRLGRAWLAVREDEDVAEALGVNLVQTKLLAYMLGAAFAGLGGAVFAALIGAAFPGDINLFVSINVAAIVIVGGMGSIPGVVVGAIFLIGLPELFRQFSEFRLLVYGIALMAIMRFRPEGLLPSTIARRELHADEENVELPGAPLGSSVAQREAETT